jgi:hypothetical protein
MKRCTKFVIVAGIVTLLVAGVIGVLRPVPPKPATGIASATPALERFGSLPESAPSPQPSAQRQPSFVQRQTEGSKFGGLAKFSAVPIEFYGKVIDQDGRPLAGVEVVGGTGSSTGFMQQETRSYTTATDSNGLFTFKGFRGDALVIDLRKAGYNFESDRVRFHYSPIDPNKKRFTPERGNPLVFQMWKSLGAEPLIHYNARSIQVPSDGTPVMIDLTKGKKVDAGGDLLISVTWGRRDDHGSYLFDWSAKVEVPEGGIIEGNGDIMFIAPAYGYRPGIEYHFAAADRHSVFARDYYVVSRNKEIYGRIRLSLQNQPGRSETDAGLRVWLNPFGSRNLEYDPTKQVSVP